MARRKKSSRKSSKCPEPLNSMIDLAAGLTMGAVASHMEKKYHYSKKGKINPYTVSAIGLTSGKMKSTKDILRTGAVLGAMGSFDVEADDKPIHRAYVPEDPVFREIRDTKVNDNRYAWRLNCVDGSKYDLSPYDFETRDAYNAAIDKIKQEKAPLIPDDTIFSASEELIPASEKFLYVRVSRLDNGINQYYLSSNTSIKIGEAVTVPTEDGSTRGIVIATAWHTTSDAPQPPEETLWIL